MSETKCLAKIPQPQAGAECYGPYFGHQTEDCLLLDVYVPVTVNGSLPVVVWFYGGAYLFGSKTAYDPTVLPLYNGYGMVQAASEYNANHNKSIIFVTGNYRLGAFGWLAGDYMERHGQPNAGLLDQRAVLQFVQDKIATLPAPGARGDPRDVSVWGESAGASSIMHQLAMPLNHNLSPPLFRKAIVQSPAYSWLWDRKSLNDTFTSFAQQVAKQMGCQIPDMDCIQSANSSILQTVNQRMWQETACDGIMPVGPSVDDQLVPVLASYQFFENNAAALDSIIVSHVDDEVPYSQDTNDWSFIPLPVRKDPQNETVFYKFLQNVFGGSAYAEVTNAIQAQYPSSNYKDQIERAQHVIADSSFLCNTRFIINNYLASNTSVYAMNYALFHTFLGFTVNGAVHGSDLLPAFANTSTNYAKLIKCLDNTSAYVAGKISNIINHNVRPGMQQYFTNHAIWGKPQYDGLPYYRWANATLATCPGSTNESEQCVTNLMKPQYFPVNYWEPWSYNNSVDTLTRSSVCQFWGQAVTNITRISQGLPERSKIQRPFNHEGDGQIVLNDHI